MRTRSYFVSARYTAFLLLAAMIGCGDDDAPPVGAVVGGVAPFDRLTGIRLGMSAGQITRQRQATLLAYAGLGERLGNARIEYLLDPPPDDEGIPYGHLTAVQARYFFPNAASAERHASISLDTIVRAIGLPSSCRRNMRHGAGFVEARWSRMNHFLEVTLLHTTADAGKTGPRYAIVESVALDTISRPGTDIAPAACAKAFQFSVRPDPRNR
jgi:hypothetical protein